MNKLLKIVVSSVLLLGVANTALSADAGKGQKLYLKKLKNTCEMNGATMATKHSQAEWKAINDAGKIGEEIKKFCPKAKDAAIQDKFLEHYFDFFYKYSNDSGNIPSC